MTRPGERGYCFECGYRRGHQCVRFADEKRTTTEKKGEGVKVTSYRRTGPLPLLIAFKQRCQGLYFGEVYRGQIIIPGPIRGES